jgi:pSer/pThr/pTyr-binding forkhead associated (FHA) protein
MMPRMPVEAPPQGGASPTVAHLTLGETTYPLVGPDVALGRGLENTIVLEDRRVSRSHARLILAHGHWTVRDEGSTNGTFVNGRMVTQHALKNGDRLSLGGLELIFHQRREGR